MNGARVPPQGADCVPGTLIRLGEALFVYRQFTDEEAEAASMPPLPGPLDTRCPALIVSLQRLQAMRGSSGPVWVCGEVGSGRSVALAHLRVLAAEAPRTSWITGGELDFRLVDEAPADAPPSRILRILPLRERVEDVPLLLDRTLGRAQQLWPRLMEALLLHDWRGNTQELRMMLRRTLHPRYAPMPGSRWDLGAFPDVRRTSEVRRGRSEPVPAESLPPDDPTLMAAVRTLSSMGRDALADALDDARWGIHAAAEALGVRRTDVFARMGELRLCGPDRSEGREDRDSARRRIREVPRGGLA